MDTSCHERFYGIVHIFRAPISADRNSPEQIDPRYPAFGDMAKNLLQLDPDAIAELCKRCGVRRLAVFGSILREDFDPQRSDADFLVEFEPLPAAQHMRSYFALRAALGDLLTHPIDLIEAGVIQNPYILKAINDQQRTIYAA